MDTMSFDPQEIDHPLIIKYHRQLDKFYKGLSTDITLIVTLPCETSKAVLAYLLELACQAQNILNIELGRKALQAIPRDWLIVNVEPIANEILSVGDEWEYRRLLEAYELLDLELVDKLISTGISSNNPNIKSTAEDYAVKFRQ